MWTPWTFDPVGSFWVTIPSPLRPRPRRRRLSPSAVRARSRSRDGVRAGVYLRDPVGVEVDHPPARRRRPRRSRRIPECERAGSRFDFGSIRWSASAGGIAVGFVLGFDGPPPAWAITSAATDYRRRGSGDRRSRRRRPRAKAAAGRAPRGRRDQLAAARVTAVGILGEAAAMTEPSAGAPAIAGGGSLRCANRTARSELRGYGTLPVRHS